MKRLIDAIKQHDSFVIIQAENLDGDSLGSSLGLESILGDMGKVVHLYCPVDIPKYLRYVPGWDRVTSDFPSKVDCAIIVDTSSETLLSKLLDTPHVRHYLETHPIIVLDHHGEVDSTLPFEHEFVLDPTAVATGEMIARAADEYGLPLSAEAARPLAISILSDSLGLTTQATSAESIETLANLVRHGANLAEIETARRLFMKKSPEILSYKADLIKRIEYFCDGKLALVHIPWEEIQAYSDQYNPSVLVLDEMRLVEGVEVAIAIKTYPDNKLTGKLRSNIPISNLIAGYFGGGGHAYAAGFRIYQNYEDTLPEILKATDKALGEVE